MKAEEAGNREIDSDSELNSDIKLADQPSFADHIAQRKVRNRICNSLLHAHMLSFEDLLS